ARAMAAPEYTADMEDCPTANGAVKRFIRRRQLTDNREASHDNARSYSCRSLRSVRRRSLRGGQCVRPGQRGPRTAVLRPPLPTARKPAPVLRGASPARPAREATEPGKPCLISPDWPPSRRVTRGCRPARPLGTGRSRGRRWGGRCQAVQLGSEKVAGLFERGLRPLRVLGG